MQRGNVSFWLALVSVLTFWGCSGGGAALPGAAPQSLASSALRVPAPAATATAAPSAAPSAAPATTLLGESFSEDALNTSASGWTVVSGTWSVCSNGSAHAYCQTSPAYAGESLVGSAAWTNYTVDALVTNPNNATSTGIALIGRATGPSSFYALELRPYGTSTTPYWYLWKAAPAGWTKLASGALAEPDTNITYHLRLSFSGTTIAAAVAFDGTSAFVPLATVSDSSYAAGQVGIHTYLSASERVDTITVTAPARAAALPADTAVSTGAFIDTIGMNAHFESPIYYDAPVHISALVNNLGVSHYRVSAGNILVANGGYLNTLTALHNAYGTTYDVLSDQRTSPAQVVRAIELLPAGSVDTVEGPNETDNPGQGSYYDPNFAVDVPAYQRALYTTIKATPATAAISVVGPSFINSTSYAAIGTIAGAVDAGNMHDYFSGFNPGTSGWGGSGYSFGPSLSYGSIAWNIASSGQATGTKPVEATETGYSTAPIHGSVPLDVQAKYVPRLFLEHFRHNVPRTYLYELVGYDTTTADGTLSIVSPSYVPNPAYTALASFIGLLGGKTAIGAPSTVDWQLSGTTANVDHLIMRKPDGTLAVALWIETESYNPNANGGAGAEVAVPAQTVTAAFASAATGGTLWTCNPQTGSWSSAPVALTNGAATFPVTDTVSVLEIPPT